MARLPSRSLVLSKSMASKVFGLDLSLDSESDEVPRVVALNELPRVGNLDELLPPVRDANDIRLPGSIDELNPPVRDADDIHVPGSIDELAPVVGAITGLTVGDIHVLGSINELAPVVGAITGSINELAPVVEAVTGLAIVETPSDDEPAASAESPSSVNATAFPPRLLDDEDSPPVGSDISLFTSLDSASFTGDWLSRKLLSI
jgi:hypothetical protein